MLKCVISVPLASSNGIRKILTVIGHFNRMFRPKLMPLVESDSAGQHV